ncbi:ABC transporter ATP-binding protein [Thalassobacillus hwangdonensis]|uniref:ABC transporter ATP-binding protein n=1 Tax=Thalassobacillus hwangdonensis TaxID=546108 RepID=A0ABW3L558_9BACI
MNRKKPVVQLKQLTKQIRKKKIIDDLSLDLYPGEVTGFLGPNGAGKTTTIRMMVGLMKPTSGEVIINGKRLDSNFEESVSHIGAIVENPEMYKYLSGFDNLVHFARMHGNISKDRINEVVRQVGLEKRINEKVQSYSLGMRQRLGLAQAMLHKPKFLILDEPTNGLDPAGIREFRFYLRKIAAEDGVAVLVSSHLLSEIELMCDRIAIIQQGKLISIRHVHEQESESAHAYRIAVSSLDEAAKILNEKAYAFEIVDQHLAVEMEKDEVAKLNRMLVENDIDVYEIVPVRKTLEDQFLEMTGGDQIV